MSNVICDAVIKPGDEDTLVVLFTAMSDLGTGIFVSVPIKREEVGRLEERREEAIAICDFGAQQNVDYDRLYPSLGRFIDKYDFSKIVEVFE